VKSFIDRNKSLEIGGIWGDLRGPTIGYRIKTNEKLL